MTKLCFFGKFKRLHAHCTPNTKALKWAFFQDFFLQCSVETKFKFYHKWLHNAFSVSNVCSAYLQNFIKFVDFVE